MITFYHIYNALKLSKIIKKLHLNRILYLILNPFIHSKIKIDETEICNARNFLQSISPNPANSCLCKPRECKSDYDLQVIIPAYKTAQYIEKCIDSVLALPTSYSIIITVVNDGSPDNMIEILKKYNSDPRVEVITQENRGFSGARNRALENIKGCYVTFLDSDDEFLKGVKIDELLSFIQRNNIEILECGYVMFRGEKDLKVMRHQDIISDKANGLLYGFPWGKIFKAELFSQIQFPERYWFEDTIMAFIIFPMCKKVATSSTLLYHYRINPQGISSTSRGNVKSLDTYWITEQLLADRVTLNLHNDKAFSEVMLGQIRMNNSRVKNLARLDIDRAVFILTADIWNKYFHDMNISSPLTRALTEYDFGKYKLLLELS